MSDDAWQHLRQWTAARIAIGRSGASLPTREVLDFTLAHARARDAVQAAFPVESLTRTVQELGWSSLEVATQCHDRAQYLQQPHSGRALAPHSRQQLEQWHRQHPEGCDLALILSDGLSAQAVLDHAPALLQALAPGLRAGSWNLGPVCLAPLGRVALQDEIGTKLGARFSLILLGERPGLGSPDSLGAYLVYAPQPGRTDADRNCVSNIRPAGCPPAVAADTILYLLTQARQRRISGVALKDERMLGNALESHTRPNPAIEQDS